MDHTELRRTGKFLLFSCSAGLIELGSFALFNEVFHWPHWAAYLTALVLSVLWNFTCNRRYTFRSSEKVARAMALVFLYYCALRRCPRCSSTGLRTCRAGTAIWSRF